MENFNDLRILYGGPMDYDHKLVGIDSIDSLIYYALLETAILILQGPKHKVDGKMYEAIGLPITKELSEQLADIPENEENFKKLAEHLPPGIMNHSIRKHCLQEDMPDYFVFVGRNYESEEAVEFANNIIKLFNFPINDYTEIPNE